MTGPCRMLTSLCVALAPMVASAQEPKAQIFDWKTIIDQRVAEDLGSYERVLNGQETERPGKRHDGGGGSELGVAKAANLVSGR